MYLELEPRGRRPVLRLIPDGPGHYPSRREWLRLGTLGGLGLSALPTLAAASRLTTPGAGKARSVLVVFASGGQSQIDTWDPKPDAPAEMRGAFRSIATSVPGTR